METARKGRAQVPFERDSCFRVYNDSGTMHGCLSGIGSRWDADGIHVETRWILRFLFLYGVAPATMRVCMVHPSII